MREWLGHLLVMLLFRSQGKLLIAFWNDYLTTADT